MQVASGVECVGSSGEAGRQVLRSWIQSRSLAVYCRQFERIVILVIWLCSRAYKSSDLVKSLMEGKGMMMEHGSSLSQRKKSMDLCSSVTKILD